MIITAVRYRKLVTGQNYSHQAIEAEARVSEFDNPVDILLELSSWVKGQFEGASAVALDPETLRQEVNSLFRQRDQLRGSVAQAQAEYEILRAKLKALNIKLDDEIPF